MAFIQLVCIQLLLLVVSYQVLANPILAEGPSDGIISGNRNWVPVNDYRYDNLEQILSAAFDRENVQHAYDKITKRRAQAKANLAGLWGVPTRFA